MKRQVPLIICALSCLLMMVPFYLPRLEELNDIFLKWFMIIAVFAFLLGGASLILVNGQAVDFSYHLQNGDRVSVYPVFETFDITPLNRLRPQPLRQPRFVLDGHLGRLAAYLRMLGFDTLYTPDAEDEHLAQLTSDEKRILLTRDRGLLKRNLVARGYCVRQDDPHAQIVEIVERFDLRSAAAPFTRCLRCNGLLQAVNKADVIRQLQPDTLQFYNEFHRCTACGQVYWKGSHYRRMQRLLVELNIA